MTREEKQLLLKDLCARLPYGVEIICEASTISLTLSVHMLGEIIKDDDELQWKPYLRPMSSMTEEENKEESDLWNEHDTNLIREMLNFYCSHHLDWNSLIPKGLALEAPKNMYKTE